MSRPGRVVAASAPGRAVVELDADAACARCARGRGCGAALFAPAGRPLRLDCALEPGASASGAPVASPVVGTRVEVELGEPGSRWLVPVVLAYGLPTLGLLAGAFAPEPWTPLAAMAGLGGGLLAWRACNAWGGGGRTATTRPAARAGPCRPVARIARVGDHRPVEGEQTA